MENMFLTREVSQLSGWLKASACCRGSQARHTVRVGLRAGRRQARRAILCERSVPGRGLQLQISRAGRAGSSVRET